MKRVVYPLEQLLIFQIPENLLCILNCHLTKKYPLYVSFVLFLGLLMQPAAKKWIQDFLSLFTVNHQAQLSICNFLLLSLYRLKV